MQEKCWVEHALKELNKDNLTSKDAIAWAAYHSSEQPIEKDPPAISALLPLFYEKAATPVMIKHGMNALKQATTFLNPGQVPVIAFDQPLFALAKMVQWKWPETHGEKKRRHVWWIDNSTLEANRNLHLIATEVHDFHL